MTSAPTEKGVAEGEKEITWRTTESFSRGQHIARDEAMGREDFEKSIWRLKKRRRGEGLCPMVIIKKDVYQGATNSNFIRH